MCEWMLPRGSVTSVRENGASTWRERRTLGVLRAELAGVITFLLRPQGVVQGVVICLLFKDIVLREVRQGKRRDGVSACFAKSAKSNNDNHWQWTATTKELRRAWCKQCAAARSGGRTQHAGRGPRCGRGHGCPVRLRGALQHRRKRASSYFLWGFRSR